MAVGVAAFVSGELIGVFGDETLDTATEIVTWLAVETHGLALLPVLALLAWAGWHFIDSYRNHR